MEFETAIALVNDAMLDQSGRLLNDAELVLFRGAWYGQTYEAIAHESGYAPSYLTRVVGPKFWKALSDALGETVSKSSFQSVLERRYRQQSLNAATSPEPSYEEETEPLAVRAASKIEPKAAAASLSVEKPAHSPELPVVDWGAAPDVTPFYGREAELTVLTQWLTGDRHRLVGVLGLGGIGKTALTVRLVETFVERGNGLQHSFQYVIWKTLRNMPPLEELLQEIAPIVSNQNDTEPLVNRLLHWLRQSRCLIVFDNMETILKEGDRAGTFRAGYEDYGELLRLIAETRHQSSVIITSREKPSILATLEGIDLTARSLQISGSPEAALALIEAKNLVGSTSEKEQLAQCYTYSPLALKIVATSIHSLFDGNIGLFLAEETLIFNGLQQLLDQQFERLSTLEQTIMFWLAINRTWTSIGDLVADIYPPVNRRQVLEALESLSYRSLIETQDGAYSQQGVVLEYVTSRLTGAIAQEIVEQSIDLFDQVALVKTTVHDYIRESQARSVVAPIAQYLHRFFQTTDALEQHFSQLLKTLRQSHVPHFGYSVGNVLNLCGYLQLDITGYDCSGLTIRHAYLQGMDLKNVNLSDAQLIQTTFNQAFSAIWSVAVSPDGQQIAIGDGSGTIYRYQTRDGRHLTTYRGHANWVVSLAFSPSGSQLASSSTDNTIRIWQVDTGQCLECLQSHTHEVWAVAFDHTGHYLASGSDDCTAKLWRVDTGECVRTFDDHTDWVLAVAFGADGQQLFTGGDDNTIQTWCVNTGQRIRRFVGHEDGVRAIALSSDGQRLASSSDDGTIRIWQVDTGACLHVLEGHHTLIYSIAFSADGTTLFSGSHDQTIRQWSVETGTCTRVYSGHRGWVLSVACHPDQNIFVSGSYDQTAKVWNAHTGEVIKTLWGYTNHVLDLAASPEGDQLAAASSDGVLRLWHLPTRQLLKTLKGHKSQVRAVAWSPQGEGLASGGQDRNVKLWNGLTGVCTATFRGHRAPIWAIAFSPDGQHLASAGEDLTIRLWDSLTGQTLHILQGHEAPIWTLQFNGDALLASGSLDETVRLWDSQTGECFRVLSGHSSWILSVAFSPDGQTLASSSLDGTIRLWQVQTGNLLKVLPINNPWLGCLAFAPDGKTLVTTTQEHILQVWSLDTGECVRTFQGHTQRLWAIATFSGSWVNGSEPHGSDDATPACAVLASAGEDSAIHLWNLSTGERMGKLMADRPYAGMRIRGTQGLTEAQHAALMALGAIDQADFAADSQLAF